MMQGISRTRRDMVDGNGIVPAGSRNVFVNGFPAVLLGGIVTPHSCCGNRGCDHHCAAKMISSSRRVFINGIGVVRRGDRASCGDIIGGSSNVFSG